MNEHGQVVRCGALAALALGLATLAGCAATPAATAQEMAAFEKLGMLQATSGPSPLADAAAPAGPYCVVPGDLLEFRMPQVLGAVLAPQAETHDAKPLQCRVRDTGTVVLPAVDELKVAGMTLGAVEAAVTAAYFPKFVAARPSVAVVVAEYQTRKVRVEGAVEKPGVYELRSDEQSLSAALMKAGGIAKDGAKVVRVTRPGADKPQPEMAIPITNQNVPMVNVALAGGERVVIERLDPQVFTVIGLVKRPGTFPYPPGAAYTVLQALGQAGGLDEVPDAQYVKVYRLSPKGEVMAVVIKLEPEDLARNACLVIRPGDALCVEQTARTRFRQGVAALFQVYAGATIPLFGN